jgi:amidohydrolase
MSELPLFRRFVWQVTLVFAACPAWIAAQELPNQSKWSDSLGTTIDGLCREVEPRVIAWRRDIHEHPELSNREFRTAKLVADHLKQLGLEVKTDVAHTGVVGILRGKSADPVVALRADMDALPVTEAVDLPFASRVKAEYRGKAVGVMHACGHDAHTAILMGVAEALAKVSDQLPGSIKFIFQPAEEGAPEGEEGGAALMIREGVLADPKPRAIFGLHVMPLPAGQIGYRPGPLMASVDTLHITIHGRQTHGAMPWAGIDPITVAAEVVLGLQTIVSRQMDLTATPVVISIGSIQGGVRENIIPDEVELLGTIRVLDPTARPIVHQRIQNTAERIAESAGATADVRIDSGYPVTVNDLALTQRSVPVLQQVVGKEMMTAVPALTVAEDFSYYQQEIPGMFFLLGIAPPGTEPGKAAPNHSPYFFVDESALVVGVRSLSHLALSELLEQ